MGGTWSHLPLPEGLKVVRDERFGFLKVIPRPTDEELVAYYGSSYRNPCVPHDPSGRAELACQFAQRRGRVLDVGCGAGELLGEFVRRGWHAVGVEPGRRYADAARRRGIEVIEEPLTDPLAAQIGMFDAVLLMHVLEHLPQPEDMLWRVRTLLRPGGVLFCEVPNDFNPLQEVAVQVAGLRPWWVVLPDHLNYFSIGTLASFVAGHGFEVLLRTTDFPIELFLLWGDQYVDNPDVGQLTHAKRCRFEEAMVRAGKQQLLWDWYAKAAELGIGREAIVCARKPA